MSRIDRMIKGLCPNGVEFQELGDVVTIHRGKSLSKADVGTGDTSIILYGQLYTTYGDYIQHVVSSCAENRARRGTRVHNGDIVMPITSTTREAQIGKASAVLVEQPVYLGGDAIALRHEQVPGYLVHVLNSGWFERKKMEHRTGTTVSHLSPSGLSTIRIPVPPLQIQHEIVRILDQFTSLDAVLEAELDARRAQHAWYWDVLLSPREGWRTTTLGELADVFDGPHATPKKTLEGPWYLSISSLKNGRFDLTESAHLTQDEYPDWTRRVTPQVGDTMFSYETRLGQAAFWDRDEPAALGRRMGLLRPRPSVVVPRFLTLLYLGPVFQREIERRTVRGSTVDRIPIAAMSTWPISVPSISEQHRIVKVLDTFDALVNGTAFGLPAELAARRKQYSYYRDKLLTFEEAAT